MAMLGLLADATLEHNDVAGFALFALVVPVIGLDGVIFRLGPKHPLFRFVGPRRLAIYRSSQPAVFRNLPLIGTFVSWAIVPVLAAYAPLEFGLPIGAPRNVQGLLIGLAIGEFLALAGISLMVLARPPRWLLPRWLQEDDARVAWVGSFDWFDKGTWAVGLIVSCMAVLMAVFGLAFFVTGRPIFFE